MMHSSPIDERDIQQAALDAVTNRLVSHYPQMLADSGGSIQQSVASGYGEPWRPAFTTHTGHVSAGQTTSWVQYVVVTNGSLWATTMIQMDLPSNLSTAPPQSPWDRFDLGLRVRTINHAIRNNTIIGVGYDGLIRAAADHAVWNGQLRHSLWARHVPYLLTTTDHLTHDAGEVDSGRFLFSLTGHPALPALLDNA